MKENVIAIDGLSCTGKSTMAQSLAHLTGFTYINTGHMYRAVARLALNQKINANDEPSLIELAQHMRIEFQAGSVTLHTIVNGEDWTTALADGDTIRFAVKVATIPKIRDILTERQREYAQRETIIMEGRDIGSVVFPHAKWKFFITASFEIRAKRLYRILPPAERKKTKVDDKVFLGRLIELDHADLYRTVAPLVKAHDAVEYDNTESPSEQEDAIILWHCIRSPQGIGERRIIYSDRLFEKAERCVQQREVVSAKYR